MLHIKEFREEHGIYASQVVEVVRERYPGYDKYLNSKVENPEKYGIRLVSDAEQMLENAFQRKLPAPRRPDRRRLPSRIQCRLSKTVFNQLQQAFRAAGFDTMQAGMQHLIILYLGKEVEQE